ncbi:hypothetical protein TRIUR3_30952 [Triticum urartu]|uniref:Uncharacterized protein n=1 Tax=Triticum urartu TaxID=4572 RepID=M7ZUE8_TRIUA|nr:hypothetical protein TRIUR3_30952 [Triticum urartu]
MGKGLGAVLFSPSSLDAQFGTPYPRSAGFDTDKARGRPPGHAGAGRGRGTGMRGEGQVTSHASPGRNGRRILSAQAVAAGAGVRTGGKDRRWRVAERHGWLAGEEEEGGRREGGSPGKGGGHGGGLARLARTQQVKWRCGSQPEEGGGVGRDFGGAGRRWRRGVGARREAAARDPACAPRQSAVVVGVGIGGGCAGAWASRRGGWRLDWGRSDTSISKHVDIFFDLAFA